MKTAKTQESPSRIRLSVEATSEEVEPALDRAFKDLAEHVKVPGFRQGKVPRRLLEARLDADTIREAVLREAVPMLLGEAVKGEEVEAIAAPSVDNVTWEPGAGMSFDATIEVRPPINLPDYAALTVSRPAVAVSEDDVEQQLAQLRERFATLETVQRPAQEGDFALIDLRTYQHDTTIDDATASDLLYQVGSRQFVEQLDEDLAGKRAGDILKFNATLPEQFTSSHAGQEVSFQVLVKEVRQKVLPAVDDEFAKTASEYDSLDELRADVRKHLEEASAARAELEVRSMVIEQLVDSSGVEAPESLVADELQYRAQRLGERLRSIGATFETYLEASGRSEDAVESDLREQAERAVKAQLVLEEVARREEIRFEKEELEEEVRRHAQDLQVEPGELRKQLDRTGRVTALAGDILRRKALELVVSRADIRSEDA